MKPYESEDDLDRGLFALSLEEPPADLHGSILAATIYAPPVRASSWEAWLWGALCALFVWLLIMAGRGDAVPAANAAIDALGRFAAGALQPQVLFWIAVGGGAAFWISQLNLTFAPGASRIVRR
jgi:hypothetical protein